MQQGRDRKSAIAAQKRLVLGGGNTLAVPSWHTRPLPLALSQGERGPEKVGLVRQ
ncbi:hypothetical protein [Leptolyngbya sp. PCC 6406]|uniref:hypothetical protein n=1 Tax=Leptolyngbya sp. PCC 6406 TaxID=1173264 RepID=UPI0002ACB2C6|nr:hypothetical protein [Leptolyngbya sp. PCC 6406]